MAADKRAMYDGELRFDEPMSKHTSWRVGGPAQRYYRPLDIADLAFYLSDLRPQECITWVGLGSNLLVRDGGVRGTVIATSGRLNNLKSVGSTHNIVRAEAGVSCAKVARFSARLGLVGAEFLAGIPGTIGGALAMNAGAFGGETWAIVSQVEVMSKNGARKNRSRDEYEIGYRTVKGPVNEWFIAADFRLDSGDSEQASQKIRGLLAKRSQTQPTQLPNAGSVFRNPKQDYSARLIEACGLKGHTIGGACVSEKHANFIINTGNATARDIERLILEIQKVVLRNEGVLLEPEVRIVGEAQIL
ncbi:MAG: UDP-N-acetylmuramate dehydrogenase [Thiohalomonadales bacterium]